MSENEPQDGVAQEPEAIEMPDGTVFMDGVEYPPGFNPAFPLMNAEAVRAHFDEGIAPADKPPLKWGRLPTQAEWDAKRRKWAEEAEDAVEAAMSVMLDGAWPKLDDCVPEGSILDLIDRAFVETTDIPRELPVFAAIHYVSALLLQKGVVIEVVGEDWRPDVWTICMAESGAGKSFASSKIGKALGGGVDLFPDSSSAAKFVEDLRDHNRGLWMRDEFAQYLKSLASDSMSDAKDYLLRCYDGSKIVRSTKTETVEIEDPALTIFGSTVFETIKDYLNREMLVDGFAQRFAFVVAERDPDRKLRALYRFAERAPEITEAWAKIVEGGLHARYRVDRLGEAAFEQAFQILLERGESTAVNLSFLKRLSHRGMKYALIYHVLLGKTSDALDAEDFGYAAKLCALNLRDLRKVLDLYEKPGRAGKADSQDAMEAVVEYLKEVQAAGGKPALPSDLQANARPLRKMRSDQIKPLMVKAVEDDPSLAPFAAIGARNLGAVKPKAK